MSAIYSYVQRLTNMRATETQTILTTMPLQPMSPSEKSFFFFFFQAEDGIRDLTVTGVQTCALPILIGKTIDAYFKKVNAEGGINGRKVNFISYDDGYSPPKAVEQVRKLVESDEVLLVFQPLGTPTNTAIQKYMNSKKVPQLFVATGATKWGDPKGNPWTMGWQPTYQAEGQIYAKYILKNHPNAKIGILFQNDDYGKDYLKGLKDGLGGKAKTMIVSEL